MVDVDTIDLKQNFVHVAKRDHGYEMVVSVSSTVKVYLVDVTHIVVDQEGNGSIINLGFLCFESEVVNEVHRSYVVVNTLRIAVRNRVAGS